MKYFGASRAKSHIIALTEGEEIIQTMIDFCAAKDIKAGFFQGIGAVESAIVAHYNLKTKRYRTKILSEPLEIVSLLGIISQKDNQVYIHCHGSFADQYFNTYGGHVKEAVISATGEVVIRESEHAMFRRPDPRTGLNLLHSGDEQNLHFPKHARGEVGP